jgi:hypothetical protein
MDVVEETLGTLERIPRFALNGTTRKQQVIILATTALTGAVVGGVASFFGTKKKLEYKYKEIKDEEVEQHRQFYMRLGKAGPFSEPKSSVEAAADAVEGYTPTPGTNVVERPKVAKKPPAVDYTQFSGPKDLSEAVEDIVANDEAVDEKTLVKVAEHMASVQTNQAQLPPDIEHVFRVAAHRQGFDYDKELLLRRSLPADTPYLITEEEFNTNLPDNEQDSLVFWLEDTTLSDSREMVVEKDVVGRANLARFGEGTDDPNMVYVHNPVHKIDYEIVRTSQSYAKMVHDIDIGGELEHSDDDMPRRRRNRRHDG